MIDFSQYRHPGVYVDAGTNPTLATVGVAPTVVCLIGNGIGYHTYTETLSFAGGPTVNLTQKGINPSSIVVAGFIADPNASGQSIPHTFVKDDVGTPHDYSVATNTSGGASASTTTVTKSTGSTIATAYPQVTVSYQYTDATYHGLHQFEDYTSIVETYGPALDAVTGALLSPLTFAAQIAILNGANLIYTIALDPAVGTLSAQFADAYTVLSANNTNVNIVVPLFDTVSDPAQISGMLATLDAALRSDELRGILRIAIAGFSSAYAGSVTNAAGLASGANSRRIVLTYPNQLEYYNGVLNATATVDGIYLAAAFAGVLSRQNPQMPLTHKFVSGFTGIPLAVARAMTNTNKDILAVGGISVVEMDRSNRMRIRHGLTTNYAGGVLNRELSLVRAQDGLYNLLQDTMENSGLIGIPIADTTALQVKAIVSGALETAKGSGLIFDYSALLVRQQAPPTGDPTVIDVRFSYRPTWPLNYISVAFTVDTTNATAAVANLTATAA